MARIAISLCGEGRGHATRICTLIEHLADEHEILVYTSADALAFLRDFLVVHPTAREVRLTYARALVNANQFVEARAEFARLTSDFPRNAEVSFAAGLLYGFSPFMAAHSLGHTEYIAAFIPPLFFLALTELVAYRRYDWWKSSLCLGLLFAAQFLINQEGCAALSIGR